MEITDNNSYCVILAGGKGKRLWPVSREKYPKQFMISSAKDEHSCNRLSTAFLT